jgi:hypothetical protein
MGHFTWRPKYVLWDDNTDMHTAERGFDGVGCIREPKIKVQRRTFVNLAGSKWCSSKTPQQIQQRFNIIHVPCSKIILQYLFQQLHNS